jgi:hypothetical protein
MATATERELRRHPGIVQPVSATAVPVLRARFSCGCRDCAFSREEKDFAVASAGRPAIPQFRALSLDGDGSVSEVLLHV